MPTLFQSSPKQGVKEVAVQPDNRQPKNNGNGSKMKPLTAFALEPTDVRFETQEEEEVVELFLRQHPVVNVFWILTTLILILAPVFIFPVFSKALPLAVPARYLMVGIAFWYLATFGYALANFLYWFFNIYIVTNERLVDIDFLYLLYKRFSEAELSKIQDISFTSGGILAAIFDYGNVNIETAGEQPNLIFEKIPHPEKVVETIRSLTENEEKETI